ncbi:MAG: hypothetical protein ACRC42_02590 [Mycoplasma sp.]
MNEIKLKSKCELISEIDWKDTIFIDKIMFDPNLFESHKQRIDKVFANAPDEVKEQQLQNILIRDTLFNRAMDKVVKCYNFTIDQKDVEVFAKLIAANIKKEEGISDEEFNSKINQIAEKLVQKELVFNQIAEQYDVKVDAEETMRVLNDYNKTTGSPIEDITSDKAKLSGAVNALLEEKITAFIINKFDKNFDELQKNIKIDMDNKAKKIQEENTTPEVEAVEEVKEQKVEVEETKKTKKPSPPPIPK